MAEQLITALRKDVTVTDEEAAYILSFFQKRIFRRNSILLRTGEVAHEVFFVVEGALHQFYIDEAGNERTCNFTFENDFVTDLESFSQQTRSASSIKALTETTCLISRCTDVVTLLQESPAMNTFFNKLVERIAAKSIKRTQALLSFSPEKQFITLMEEQPDILQRVPQRYIAQYLGIAPESLSRIRKRLMSAGKS
ncbi:CRP-like cAMP-binding protein [Filimonas zeae]|uniref:Cyclic nucleotide-binding protein n=1 Tax=Filimonas zeae TaxID=1737353 RepID=A0A917IZT9_9BACT|nr:Crp/Fnr family transcriptional regulator [Filimonas zeae]MDR6340330.1 CRP-like cAMP-binding protein [Filimonas zeae]GGH72236.1 cyclic nucleotide-binding protein [Filimonas zeae]